MDNSNNVHLSQPAAHVLYFQNVSTLVYAIDSNIHLSQPAARVLHSIFVCVIFSFLFFQIYTCLGRRL